MIIPHVTSDMLEWLDSKCSVYVSFVHDQLALERAIEKCISSEITSNLWVNDPMIVSCVTFSIIRNL